MLSDVASLHEPPSLASVRAILEQPGDRAWVLQDVGLLGLRLGDDRTYRLHVWDPDSCIGEPPIHDHPFHFTSTVFAGAITNTRYDESPLGVEYQRDRYAPSDEDDRLTDVVRLSGASTTYRAGESYSQRAGDLHSSAQMQGTVTVLCKVHIDVPRLTVCRRPGNPWVSGRSRPASAAEVRRITGAALDVMI